MMASKSWRCYWMELEVDEKKVTTTVRQANVPFMQNHLTEYIEILLPIES